MLNQLKPKTKFKDAKRVGRGGKRGTTSGKGQKGQGSRAGHKKRPATRDLIIRIPKLRGIKNKPLQEKALSISLTTLENKMKDTAITRDSLIAAGIIRKSEKRIKILSTGEVTKAFTVKGIEISESAKQKIEAKGGSVEK